MKITCFLQGGGAVHASCTTLPPPFLTLHAAHANHLYTSHAGNASPCTRRPLPPPPACPLLLQAKANSESGKLFEMQEEVRKQQRVVASLEDQLAAARRREEQLLRGGVADDQVGRVCVCVFVSVYVPVGCGDGCLGSNGNRACACRHAPVMLASAMCMCPSEGNASGKCSSALAGLAWGGAWGCVAPPRQPDGDRHTATTRTHSLGAVAVSCWFAHARCGPACDTRPHHSSLDNGMLAPRGTRRARGAPAQPTTACWRRASPCPGRPPTSAWSRRPRATSHASIRPWAALPAPSQAESRHPRRLPR